MHDQAIVLSCWLGYKRVVRPRLPMLNELQRFTTRLIALSPNLDRWLLGGDTQEEALLYEVFRDGAVTTAAKAVLETQLQGKSDPRCIVIWNGRERHEGASIEFIGRPTCEISLVRVFVRPKSFSSDWRAIADVMMAAVSIWSPHYIALESNGYFERKTFKDRPGAGWMLYLPRVLTVQQVPEARALVPIMGKDAKGIDRPVGTIVVSVTDQPFSDEDTEHVKAAHAIEIRLVDQDLLPRYAEL